ncbi:MAG: FRG domain-containing protein [Oscillospiraceae bacterium]|jgi:hypothetical protein|nr:FRG domain-containing protein [Oscillospiraceae bacterium]
MRTHSIDYYSKRLLSPRSLVLDVHSLADYINAATAIRESYPKREVYFRGQASTAWEISSTAYREIEKETEKPFQRQLQELHEQLVDAVKHLHDTDLNQRKGVGLLAHLQHNGAKTNLIDYTKNPLVALWFACRERPGESGAVYYLEHDRKKTPEIQSEDSVKELFSDSGLRVFDPPNLNQRIVNQQGLFLFDVSGKINKDMHGKIMIDSAQKKSFCSILRIVGFRTAVFFRIWPV